MRDKVEHSLGDHITLEVLSVNLKSLDELILLAEGLTKYLLCSPCLMNESNPELLIQLHQRTGLIVLRPQVFTQVRIDVMLQVLHVIDVLLLFFFVYYRVLLVVFIFLTVVGRHIFIIMNNSELLELFLLFELHLVSEARNLRGHSVKVERIIFIAGASFAQCILSDRLHDFVVCVDLLLGFSFSLRFLIAHILLIFKLTFLHVWLDTMIKDDVL